MGIRIEARHHRLGPVGTGPYPLANGQCTESACWCIRVLLCLHGGSGGHRPARVLEQANPTAGRTMKRYGHEEHEDLQHEDLQHEDTRSD